MLKKKFPALSLSKLTKILFLWLINVKHDRYFVCCHLLVKISVWKLVKPLISISSRGCKELFTSSFFLHSLQNIIYDAVTADCCSDVTLGFLHSVTPISAGNSTRQWSAEMSKSMCYDLSPPQACWEHRHYVMPDRALLHQDINSSLFVRTTKWIGRLLFYSFSVRKAVSSFIRAIWGKQTLGHRRWCNRQGALARAGLDYIKNLSYLLVTVDDSGGVCQQQQKNSFIVLWKSHGVCRKTSWAHLLVWTQTVVFSDHVTCINWENKL